MGPGRRKKKRRDLVAPRGEAAPGATPGRAWAARGRRRVEPAGEERSDVRETVKI
jgi:hypothetical protein